jgi:hypothetical protein
MRLLPEDEIRREVRVESGGVRVRRAKADVPVGTD